MDQIEELRQMFSETVADLVRAERAVVLLRNLVDTERNHVDLYFGSDRDASRAAYHAFMNAWDAARRYLAELDAADTDMV